MYDLPAVTWFLVIRNARGHVTSLRIFPTRDRASGYAAEYLSRYPAWSAALYRGTICNGVIRPPVLAGARKF